MVMPHTTNRKKRRRRKGGRGGRIKNDSKNPELEPAPKRWVFPSQMSDPFPEYLPFPRYNLALEPVRWFSRVKVLLTKLDNLSSFPGPHMMEGENRLSQVVL